MEQNTNIAAFLDEDGKIKQLPARSQKRIPVLCYLCGKFEKDRIYSEKEVNRIIDQWHTFGDYFILRRELVDQNLMARKPDGSAYWVVERVEGDQQWNDAGNSYDNIK